jgi:hypothetical protein
MNQYSQENNPVQKTISAPKTLQEQNQMIDAQLRTKMKEMVANGANPKEALMFLRQEANDAKANRAEIDKQNQIASFENETDPRKKIMIGMRSGLIGKEGAMMLIQPNVETKVINTGGANVVVGFDKMTGKYVNLKDGVEIAADELQTMLTPTLSPAQQEQFAIQREGQQITRDGQRLRATGGGGTGGSTSSKMSMYRWASGYSLQPTGEVDIMGKPVMTRVQNNPQLAAQLAQELGYGGQGGGQGEVVGQLVQNTGDSRIDGMIAKMRNNGAPEQIINDMVWEEQNRGQDQPPQQSPQYQEYGTESTPDMLQPQDRTIGKFFEPVVNFFKRNADQYDEYGRPR